MKKPAAALLTLLGLSAAQALTLQGSVVGGAGLPPSARLGLWSVQPSGAAGSELSSTAITGGSFILTWPDEPPPSRAQFPLRPEAIGWPGVIGDVQLSAPVQSAATNLYVYNDANGNGKRDDNETLFDAFPEAQREALITVWVSGAVMIKAGRGFSAALKSGWNTFLVDLGRSAAVSSYNGQPISVRVQR